MVIKVAQAPIPSIQNDLVDQGNRPIHIPALYACFHERQ